MSADPQVTTPTADAESERFVKIPHALRGQEYKPPRNFANPALSGVYRLMVTLLCLSLPVVPGVIFVMILTQSQAIHFGLLWLWIVMIIFIETIAIGVAWGVAREALGYAGVSYSRTSK